MKSFRVGMYGGGSDEGQIRRDFQAKRASGETNFYAFRNEFTEA